MCCFFFRKRFGLLVGALGLIVPLLAWSQAGPLPALPPSAEPDVRLRSVEGTPLPPSPSEPIVPQGAESSAPEGADLITFTLTAIEVDGLTAYPPSTFDDIFAPLYGTKVSLAQVYGIAAEIQRRYRNDGYFLSRVLVPPQHIVGGRVRLDVAEGHVDRVEIQDDVGGVQKLLESYFSHITAEKPLRLQTLERYLLLANDVPGIDVKGILQPSQETTGAARLVVTAKRKKLDGLVLIDNIGSTFTGNWEIAGRAISNSFTRFGESLGLTALISSPEKGIREDQDNQMVGALNGSFRVGGDGAYVNTLISYGNSNPGSIISEFDYKSTQLLASLGVGYPIIRSRDHNLFVESGFDYIDSDTNVFTDVEFVRDRIRTLWLTASYDFRDRWRGSTYLSLGVRQGLEWLGASEAEDPLLSRYDAQGAFTSLRATASRIQGITEHWSLYGIVSGQYAFQPVLSEEEFDVGGIDFGRGYNPKEISGDRGVGLTTEIQYTRPSASSFLDRYQGFAFFDFGSVWQSGVDLTQSLSSAGGGLRGWFARDLSMELLVAKPLTRPSQRADGTKDPQLLFRLIALF